MEKLEHQYGADALVGPSRIRAKAALLCHMGRAGWSLVERRRQSTSLRLRALSESRNTYGSPRVRLDSASWANAVARTGLPGLCRRAACAPGRSAVSGLAPLTAAIMTRSRKTGWRRCRRRMRPGQLWQSNIAYIETKKVLWPLLSMAVRAAASLTPAGETCSVS